MHLCTLGAAFGSACPTAYSRYRGMTSTLMDGKKLINSDSALLDILFDHVPVALAIWDSEIRLLRCNLTWAEYIVRYTAAQATDVVPGVGLFELAPEIEPGPVACAGL